MTATDTPPGHIRYLMTLVVALNQALTQALALEELCQYFEISPEAADE